MTMSSEDTYTQDHAHAHARTRPGSDVIHEAREQEVLDKDGRKHRLGDLISGKRTCLVFIRHFCEPPPYLMSHSSWL